MTDSQLLAKAVAQSKLITAWEARINPKVQVAVDKAHAHAVIALTERLKQTPAGRPTLRSATQSPSYQSACADLRRLWFSLCGPSKASLDGLLRDARESLYRASYASWIKFMPDESSVGSETFPPASRIPEVRGLILHGYELRNEVGPKILKAETNLLATLEQASKPGVVTNEATKRISDWADVTRISLISTIQTCLSDAAVAVQSIALIDAMKPEFRPNDGIAPE